MTAAAMFELPSRRHRSLLRDGLTICALVYLVWVWQFLLATGSHVDATAYLRAAVGDPYLVSQAGRESAFLYSPVIAQLLTPVAAVPLSVFVGGLLAISLVGAVYLVGPMLAAAALLTPLPFVWQDLGSGNIHVLLAAAIVLGFRFPVAWSFVLLTKVTPEIGLLWFAARREWRALGLALGATALLAGASFLFAPALWTEWINVLRINSAETPTGLFVPGPLPVRLVVAAALVWWGARRGYAWTVPLAAMLALPVIWIYDGFAMLLGVVSVLRRPVLPSTFSHVNPSHD